MKKVKILAALLLSVTMLFSSCEAVKNTSSGVKGGVIGTAAGGAVGAGVGALAGNTALGAVIGGVVGGTAGALIGHKMDVQKRELEKIEGAQVESVNNGEAIKVTFESGILFGTNSSTLGAASKTSLSKFATSLNANPETNVNIFGHTDSSGSDNVNLPLSQQRAASVQNYLVSQGVNATRLTAVGKGSSEPIADNTTSVGKSQNRRVEVYILPNAKMLQEAQQGTLK